MATLTQEEAHRLFEYRDGMLYWKIPRRGVNKLSNGDYPVGWKNGSGYRCLSVSKKKYYLHQIVFLMHHGYIPKTVDHIDGNGLNNKIDNLREATIAQNNCNSIVRSDNTSGVKGVSWHKAAKKWTCSVNYRGKAKHLGLYEDFDLACLVASEARLLYHGAYARI
jgi:hypothetical protein